MQREDKLFPSRTTIHKGERCAFLHSPLSQQANHSPCLPKTKQAPPASIDLLDCHSWSRASPYCCSTAEGGTTASPSTAAMGSKVSFKKFSLFGISKAKYSLYAKFLLIPGTIYIGNVLRIKEYKTSELLCDASLFQATASVVKMCRCTLMQVPSASRRREWEEDWTVSLHRNN